MGYGTVQEQGMHVENILAFDARLLQDIISRCWSHSRCMVLLLAGIETVSMI